MKETKELAKNISRFVNSHSRGDYDTLAEEMAKDHQTLIQDKATLFLKFFKIMADRYDKGSYDLRSEATCKLGKDIIEANNGSSELPFI